MEKSHILPIHKRLDVAFKKGKGVNIFDKNNKKYLDFGSGIAVNSLGHCHPKLIKALKTQCQKLWHVSNLYHINELEEVAQLITKNTFADYAFFCNSGAEAVECAIKMIRKYFFDKGQKDKYEIITFQGSFHGRTMATISASGNEKYLEGFGPNLPGFRNAIFNDIESVKKLINKNTAGILIEPVQGEGGIVPAQKKFMQELREIANKNNLLLALDEVQCGAGRTGYLYAYEYYNIKPDILASAKGIGGGFPVGICLATESAAFGMKIGTHGTTYGGNPLAMKVTQEVIKIISKKSFLKNIQKQGDNLINKLQKLQESFPKQVKEIRGLGLMVGIELDSSLTNIDFVEQLKNRGLLSVPAGKNTVRLVPPLIIKAKHLNKANNIIKSSLKYFAKNKPDQTK